MPELSIEHWVSILFSFFAITAHCHSSVFESIYRESVIPHTRVRHVASHSARPGLVPPLLSEKLKSGEAYLISFPQTHFQLLARRQCSAVRPNSFVSLCSRFHRSPMIKKTHDGWSSHFYIYCTLVY